MGDHRRTDPYETIPVIVDSFRGRDAKDILKGLEDIAKMAEAAMAEVCRLRSVVNHREAILNELHRRILELGLPGNDPKATIIAALEHYSKFMANNATGSDSRCSCNNPEAPRQQRPPGS